MILLILVYVSVVNQMKGIVSFQPTLSPTSAVVYEYENVNLTCYSDQYKGNTTIWYLNTTHSSAIVYDGKLCIGTGFFKKTIQYSLFCLNSGSFVLQLKNVSRAQNGNTWQCLYAGFPETDRSNIITVSVTVPVNQIEIAAPNDNTNTVNITEKRPKKIKCNVPYSHPTPKVDCFFFKDYTTIKLEVQKLTNPGTSEFRPFEYDITLLPNRTFNRWVLYCNASNIPNVNVTSNRLNLNIFYAPGGPTIHGYGNGDTYKVIEGHKGSLSCILSGGHPAASPTSLKWSCCNGSRSTSLGINITSKITWTASRQTCMQCNCISNHLVKNGSTTALIDVLYPPNVPKLLLHNRRQNISLKLLSLDIIENASFTVICETISNPPPSYSWRKAYTDGQQVLKLQDVPRSHNKMKYTCYTWNYMNASEGDVETGYNITSFKLNVLYPPDILNLHNQHIVEGSQFYLPCNVSSGNPSNMTVKWTREKDNFDWNTDTLTIESVNKTDDSNFTCTVNYTLIPTDDETRNGNINERFHLSVLFPPSPPTLILLDEKLSEVKLNSGVLVVIENTSLKIKCNTTSNPSATYSWKRRQGQESKLLEIPNVSREDKGTHTCHCRNEMIPSVGSRVPGYSNSSIKINVEYPPDIQTLTLIQETMHKQPISEILNVIENTSFKIICNTVSNPHPSYSWDLPSSEGSPELTKTNITRRENGTYTCHTWNTMNPTFGKKVTKYRNASVSIDVMYKADNMQFKTTALRNGTNFITHTFESFQIMCSVESNPMSNISIEFNNSAIASAIKGNYLTHNISTTECSHAGIYSCFGRNEYNENDVKSYLTIFVKCIPQPSTEVAHKETIKAALHSSATLTFTAAPYLDPGKTDFTWMRKRNFLLEPVGNEADITISENNLQTNLTVISVTQADFGEYIIWYNNSIGSNNFTFRIQRAEFSTETTGQSDPENNPNIAGIATGSVIGLVGLIAGIIIGITLYRKKNSKENGSVYQNVPFSGNHITIRSERNSLHIEETLFEGLQEVDDVPIITKERTEYCNSPESIEKIDRIKVTELFSYVSGRSEESFEADYQKLPTELQKPCTFARKPENIALNRYNGIYPYDHSRVKLHGQPDFFINACYIDGYKSSKEYIASLGPTAKTTNEFTTFWKMIWYERVDVIVMLTNLREPSGMKCEKYWPEGGASIWYGDVCVSSETTQCFAEYTIRHFSVSKEDDRRSLTHLHYTAWPDKTVPEDVTSLIEFRQRIKITPTSSGAPIVVHCSAGIGRTGTLIALDRLIKEGQDKGSINVFECVDSMREQRVKMVQTFEQYMYIYKALVNALTFDFETIPVETFNEYVAATNNNMYSMMFQQLRQSVETDSKTDVEARWKNEKLTNKNRLGADIPGSRFRAMLYLNRTGEGSEYINAVYINSFVKRDNLIAAQSPLPCTVADFLTMVYQEDCSCIATMEDLKDPGMTVGQYLPDDKKTLTVGNFKVSSSRLETKHTHVVRKMKIIYSGKFDSGEKTIYHFQYTKWMTGRDTPIDAKEFLQFLNDVKEYANEFGEERSHVLVHCLKANERSGLFCALAILMEKIQLEQQVNVLNTLRHLRTRRQTAITSMDQLKFCFQATSEYIKMRMLR